MTLVNVTRLCRWACNVSKKGVRSNLQKRGKICKQNPEQDSTTEIRKRTRSPTGGKAHSPLFCDVTWCLEHSNYQAHSTIAFEVRYVLDRFLNTWMPSRCEPNYVYMFESFGVQVGMSRRSLELIHFFLSEETWISRNTTSRISNLMMGTEQTLI